MEQRSLVLFTESLKSEHTRKQYCYYLDKFREFYKIKDFDSLLTIQQDKIQIMIEDYTLVLKKKVSPNTLPTMIFGIKSFFEANDIELKWKKIKKLFPEKVKLSGRQSWSLKQIQSMLEARNLDLRARALILFLASSGVRIGAVPDLKLKHLTEIENCKMITVYADTKDEYQTFLTPEASEALTNYLTKRKQDREYFDQNTPLFRARYKLGGEKVRPADKASLQAIIGHILIRCGIRQAKPGKYQRYETQIDHGFRKFFNEALKSTPGINLAYAEKLMGHSVTIPLDNNYLNPNIDKLFVEYTKVITALTIDDNARLRTKNQELAKSAKASKEQLEEIKEFMGAFTDAVSKLEKAQSIGEPLITRRDLLRMMGFADVQKKKSEEINGFFDNLPDENTT